MVFYLLLPPIREMVVDWPRIDILCFLECYKTNYASQESTTPNPNYFDHKTPKIGFVVDFSSFQIFRGALIPRVLVLPSTQGFGTVVKNDVRPDASQNLGPGKSGRLGFPVKREASWYTPEV